LRKPDPAELAKRNALLAELDFEIERMRARTEEHCDFTQRHTFLAQVRDALRDKARLLILIVRAYHYRRLPAVNARVKPFLEALFDVSNDFIRDVENRLRAAK